MVLKATTTNKMSAISLNMCLYKSQLSVTATGSVNS